MAGSVLAEPRIALAGGRTTGSITLDAVVIKVVADGVTARRLEALARPTDAVSPGADIVHGAVTPVVAGAVDVVPAAEAGGWIADIGRALIPVGAGDRRVQTLAGGRVAAILGAEVAVGAGRRGPITDNPVDAGDAALVLRARIAVIAGGAVAERRAHAVGRRIARVGHRARIPIVAERIRLEGLAGGADSARAGIPEGAPLVIVAGGRVGDRHMVASIRGGRLTEVLRARVAVVAREGIVTARPGRGVEGICRAGIPVVAARNQIRRGHRRRRRLAAWRERGGVRASDRRQGE